LTVTLLALDLTPSAGPARLNSTAPLLQFHSASMMPSPLREQHRANCWQTVDWSA